MNIRFLLLLGLLLAGTARAQVTTGFDPVFDARERERIAAERTRAVERYAGEEAYCYQRFAVNDCLIDVRRRKRVVIEELRRQEVVLNDQRRTAAAAAEQKRVEERQLERDAPDAQSRRDEARQSYDERQVKAQERRDEAAMRDTTGGASNGVAPAKSSAQTPSASDAAARRAENVRAYDEKQQRAQEHRDAHERDLANQGQPLGKPLPLKPVQP